VKLVQEIRRDLAIEDRIIVDHHQVHVMRRDALEYAPGLAPGIVE